MIADLKRCVDPETAGNPCSDEKWVRSRLRGLSQALGRRACPTTIGRLLRDADYGLRSHRKVLHTGKHHAERDQQFQHIAEQRDDFRRTGDPHISVDTKKKELIGQFRNPGQTWRSARQGEAVNDHDFATDAEGRAAPYGVYDQERNAGHVRVTLSSDTADLAVDTVAEWWNLNRTNYPQARRLLIEADSGGSNGSRSRRYKKRLQDLADQTGLEITVCHYPPGTSKWNPIEHRLFSQISRTWAGHVLSTLLILLGWIRRTTTQTGLTVTATTTDQTYETGLKVSNAEFKTIQLTRNTVCPQWNYTIRPRPHNTV